MRIKRIIDSDMDNPYMLDYKDGKGGGHWLRLLARWGSAFVLEEECQSNTQESYMRSMIAAAVLLLAQPVMAQDYEITTSVGQVKPDGSYATTVFYWSPTAPDRPVALDLFPRGTPASNSRAWIHICDSDLTVGQAGFGCAYAGVTTLAARFGSARFGVGPIRPVQIHDGTVLATFKRENGDTGLPQLIVGPFDSLAVANQAAEWRRENARLFQRVKSLEVDKARLRDLISKLEARVNAMEIK